MNPSADRKRAGRAPRLRRGRTALAAIVALVFLGLISHGHYAASGDAVHYMMIARSIVLDGDADLRNDYGAPGNILTPPVDRHALPGRGGALRPVHDVGLPLVAAPYFGAAYRLAELTDGLPETLRRRAKLDRFIALRQLMSLFMIAVTAWLACVFFETSSSLTGERSLAWIAAAAWTLSPPILTHGYVFLTEVPTALIALLAYRHRGAGLAGAGRGLLLGLCTGLLVLVHVRNVGLVLGLAGVTLWTVRRQPAAALAYVAGLSAAGGIKVALNLFFWGTVLTTPHAQLGVWPGVAAVAQTASERLLGLVFDGRHGLLPSAPLYLAAPAAWLLLWQRSRAAAVEILLIVGLYLLFVLLPVTNVHGWRGGWSPAARFLVPVAPFLMLGMPLLLVHRLARWMIVPLLGAQLLVDGFLWGHPMLTWSEGSGAVPWIEGLLGMGAAARAPVVDGLGTAWLIAGVLLLLGWWAVSLAVVSVGRLRQRPA